MAPAVSLKSRIDAFESLAGVSSHDSKFSVKSPHPLEAPIPPSALSYASITPLKVPPSKPKSPSPSPPQLGRKTSLIDLKDWVVEDGPLARRQNGFKTLTNGKPSITLNSGRPSTPGKLEKSHPSTLNSILINVDIPPAPKAPPLPPRKTSYTSLKSVSSSGSPQNNKATLSPYLPPTSSDTLTVLHTYPPQATLDTNVAHGRPGHATASSVSSFHSVSLSSDGGATDAVAPDSASNHISTPPRDRESGEADAFSLGESFEDVSKSSIASPKTAADAISNWQYPTLKRHPDPPRLPQRPSPNISPTHTPTSPKSPVPQPPSSSSSSVRRPAPPPPSRKPSRPSSTSTSLTSTTSSDRSSILSTTTATTSSRTSVSSIQTPIPTKPTQITRLTPIPPSARARYEKLFVVNVLNCQKQSAAKNKSGTLSPGKKRQAAGWRGLSVDLITNSAEHPLNSDEGERKGIRKDKAVDVDEVVSPEERLDGCIVKLIWSASRLGREKLRDIWNECDVFGHGALDRESFIKGMWRIDEELRRAQAKSSSRNSTRRFSPLPKPTSSKTMPR